MIFIVNIALNKPAYQSGSRDKDDAKNAVDGRKSDQSWNGGECSRTVGNQNATWWVNLTTIHTIHHIVIYYMTNYQTWGNANILLLLKNIPP